MIDDESRSPFTSLKRPYTQQDVERLQGRTRIEYTLAKRGAGRLKNMMMHSPAIRALGAMTGNQAVQMARAGLKSVYCSGWQVAADANTAGHSYPDQSLYPVDSVPTLVKRINNALLRAEQIDHMEGNGEIDWMLPIVADAEAGFGGPLNAYELMKSMIEAGAAGVHFEDQLSSAKKCGHMGGKVLVPTGQFIQTLIAARLASDVLEVPTLIIARTDADSADLLTSDIDPADNAFIDHTVARTQEGFYRLTGDPMDRCVARALAYAPHADMLWMETSKPNLEQARQFARRVHEKFPNKPLCYNLSPSFNWRKHLSPTEIETFQDDLSDLGYSYHFITLAGWHSVSHGMFELAKAYNETGMSAYAAFQDGEFNSVPSGYTAVKHQREAGASIFDAITQAVSGGSSSTMALKGSTEAAQFTEHDGSGSIQSGHG